jgi:hypothetical protein
MNQRPLGKTQQKVLDCLREHRTYYAGCGWVWDTHRGTVRILDSLVKRGLVTRIDDSRAWSTYKPLT